ncbi:11161_t:CDS:2 [Ambispora leptoticha]|uniref:11161_t:CDS:1 n=1 Tax=Ambispora leptoticha TaxID=144679 RepID=A0A9N8WEZ2_9GLOM|nr:11161_t:CDS:2 [Ambispora leptoticha]
MFIVTEVSGGSNFAVLAIVTIVLGQEYYTRQIIATLFQIT